MTEGVIDILAAYRRRSGVFGAAFCSAPHPDAPGVWCRRQLGHPGDHSAFIFKISTPESWPTT